jgi:GMP synthase-like glutamine amidotransferase
VGLTEYDFAGHSLRLNAWHRDQVVAVPPGADVIAANAFCRVAGLAYRGVPGLSVQAHPEFGADVVAGLMRTRGVGLVPEPLLQAAAARLSEAADQPVLAEMIADFFRTHAPDNHAPERPAAQKLAAAQPAGGAAHG